MSRLLAAQRPSTGRERLEDVTVADGGDGDIDAMSRHRAVEPEIRHDGDNKCVFGQHASLGEVQGEHAKQTVAVDDVASSIYCDEAIGITVERQTQIGARCHNPGSQR